ncbi:TetR/AcrR family transcriptional regulator [Roseicyclus sp.]|uniref:TetR/AcrR family transcriptional regulator n=1 Tax=Roseicyclus sp. TaxID=1914329 RepID=UPI003F9EF0C0
MAEVPHRSYHHGDLRRAILDAAEAELAERGHGGLSMRRVAARVGVSHTAPAHHFGDLAGLLEALATRGFQRLVEHMSDRQVRLGPDASPYERLMASGLGYLDFAMESPALFRLVFGLSEAPRGGTELQKAADAAFLHLASDVGALHGTPPMGHPEAFTEVLACWTRVHGLAELMISGYLPPPGDGSAAARDALFRSLFEAEFPYR